jgi:hypothetical protein
MLKFLSETFDTHAVDMRSSGIGCNAMLFALHSASRPFLFEFLVKRLLGRKKLASFVDACRAIEYLQSETPPVFAEMVDWADEFLPEHSATFFGVASGYLHLVGCKWVLKNGVTMTAKTWAPIRFHDIRLILEHDELRACEEDVVLMLLDWEATRESSDDDLIDLFSRVRYSFVRDTFPHLFAPLIRSDVVSAAALAMFDAASAVTSAHERSVVRKKTPFMHPRTYNVPTFMLLGFGRVDNAKCLRTPDGRALMVTQDAMHIVSRTGRFSFDLMCLIELDQNHASDQNPSGDRHVMVVESAAFSDASVLFFVSRCGNLYNMHTIRLDCMEHSIVVSHLPTAKTIAAGSGMLVCTREMGDKIDILFVEPDGSIVVQHETELNPAFSANHLTVERLYTGALVLANMNRCYSVEEPVDADAQWTVFNFTGEMHGLFLDRVITKTGKVLFLFAGELRVWDIASKVLERVVRDIPKKYTRMSLDHYGEWLVLGSEKVRINGKVSVSVGAMNVDTWAIERSYVVHPRIVLNDVNFFLAFEGVLLVDHDIFDIGI